MKMTGAQAIVESLKMEGVTHIFGYAGATICPVDDALRTSGISYTLVRTEQNAGHMASGYARASGKVGVCKVTSGPGATNLITGIATAYMDSIPVVAITGQVASSLLGRDIFQEVDISGAVTPFIKHSYIIKNVKDIPRIVKEAFHIASTGRKGPVLIDCPIDIQNQTLDFSYPDEVNIRGYKPSVKGNDFQVKRVADAINSARCPLIFAGGGVIGAGAEKELRRLSETAGIPVVKTMMGIGVMPSRDPMNIGMVGSHGMKAANWAMSSADLLIIAGARAADRAIPAPVELEKKMKIVHIDVDPAEIGKNMTVNIPLVGDVKVVLNQIMELSPRAQCAEWVERLRELRNEDLKPGYKQTPGYVNPKHLIRALCGKLRDDACICVDVGQNQIWAAKYCCIKNGSFFTTGGLGTMGYSLPAALGVKTAQPERQTVVICGDGSFQMFLNELSTLRNMDTDVKIVLFRNNVLGMVNEIQKSSYGGPFGVDLGASPDFEMLAGAYGIECSVINEDREAEDALDRMLSSRGGYLLVSNTDPNLTSRD